MAFLAAACGVVIILFGLLTIRRSPTDAQLNLEVTCLVGGLVLCFLAVALARVSALGRSLRDRGRATGE